MGEIPLKVCVLGAAGAGKSLLARTLAEQLLAWHVPYSGCTPVLRIQEVTRPQPGGGDLVRVQLWDVAGRATSQPHWEVLARGIDGVMLVLDPAQPQAQQERELEQLYLAFAQPHELTMKQCLVVAVDSGGSSSGGGGGGAGKVGSPGAWPGLAGKLKKLPAAHVSLSPSVEGAANGAALEALDRLLTGCLARRKDRVERAVMGD